MLINSAGPISNKPMTEIARQVQDIDLYKDEVRRSLAQLLDRLSPVLSPQPPSAQAGSIDPIPSTDLGQRLHDTVKFLNELRDTIDSTLNRMEL